MLYTVRIEPNKTFLRALMTHFFASSPVAHEHLAQIEAFTASADECRKSHFQDLWSKAAQAGPLPQRTLTEFSRRAEAAASRCYDSYVARIWAKAAQAGPVQPTKIEAQASAEHKRSLDNAKALFFAHLVEFVRNLKVPTSKFERLPDTADTVLLKEAIKDNLGKIVHELQDNKEIQDIILADYTPGRMEKPLVQPALPLVIIAEKETAIVPLLHEGLNVGIPLSLPETTPAGLRLH